MFENVIFMLIFTYASSVNDLMWVMRNHLNQKTRKYENKRN